MASLQPGATHLAAQPGTASEPARSLRYHRVTRSALSPTIRQAGVTSDLNALCHHQVFRSKRWRATSDRPRRSFHCTPGTWEPGPIQRARGLLPWDMQGLERAPRSLLLAGSGCCGQSSVQTQAVNYWCVWAGGGLPKSITVWTLPRVKQPRIPGACWHGARQREASERARHCGTLGDTALDSEQWQVLTLK